MNTPEIRFLGDVLKVDQNWHEIKSESPINVKFPGHQYEIQPFKYKDITMEYEDGCLWTIPSGESTRVQRLKSGEFWDAPQKGKGHLLVYKSNSEIKVHSFDSNDTDSFSVQHAISDTIVWIADLQSPTTFEVVGLTDPAFRPEMEEQVLLNSSELPQAFWQKYWELRYGSETYQQALELSQAVTDFSQMTTDDQAKSFGATVETIKRCANEKTLQIISDYEKMHQLSEKSEQTLKSPVDIIGTMTEVWKGSATIVVVDSTGQIGSFFSKRPEIMTEYGNDEFNFYVPALIKALAQLHLHKLGLARDGIGKNFRYLKKTGFPFHRGADQVTIGNGEILFIGASGCEMTTDTLSWILDGATPTYFTIAGLADEAFAELVAKRIAGGISDPVSTALDGIVAAN